MGSGSIELGRGSNDLGRGINVYEILLSELFYLQTAQKRKKAKGDIQKAKGDRLTDQPTQEEEKAKKNEMPKGSMWSSVPLPQFY